jgi:arylsulfatase A-like enzyme
LPAHLVPAARPNIVLVMTDQHRGDALGCDGHPHLLTPNLDALAGRGVRFTRAYSECPTCIPARHALMTGLKPSRSGVVGFSTTARIATPDQTLPALLRGAGYQTASIGRSMHTHPSHARYGFEITRHSPFADPYSEYNSLFRNSHRGQFGNWPHLNLHGLPSNGWTSRSWPYEERFHQTNFAISQAIAFLDSRDREAPFFLSVGTVAPHPPLVPPACYYDRYARVQLDQPVVGDWAPMPFPSSTVPTDAPELVLSAPAAHLARVGYYGLINHVDDQLGLLLERLRMEDEPTYLIFTSDHGEMLGDHHCFRKALPFESAARVPMIVVGPDVPDGLVCDRPVGLLDLLPTCLRFAGIEAPFQPDGIDLVETATGNARQRDWLHLEHAPLGHRWGGWHALTDGQSKYIWFAGSGRELLFDLQADPRELHDLSAGATRQSELALWRSRLVEELKDRPEGFVRDDRLLAGVAYRHAMPHARSDQPLEKWER